MTRKCKREFVADCFAIERIKSPKRTPAFAVEIPVNDLETVTVNLPQWLIEQIADAAAEMIEESK